MKRILILMTLTVLFLTGCSNAPKTRRDIEVNVSRESSYIKTNVYFQGNNGLRLVLSNESDDVVTIDWNSSSLAGSSIFTGGIYRDRFNPIIPKVIPPYTTITQIIYPANSVYYDTSGSNGTWRIRRMNYPAKLVLKITKGNEHEFLIYDINEKITPITQE